MTDQSKLLDQLKIDRTETPPTGLGTGAVVTIALVSAAIGAAAMFWLAPSKPVSSDSSAPAVVESKASEPQQTEEITAADPPEDSGEEVLNASGYVTARRIATVSSQITGLITEVNVEEGMVVETEQVLAKLDDALARVDYELAVARLASQRAAVENTRANLAEAERVFERAKKLRPQGLESEAELTQAPARYDALIAPFAGVVTVKNAQTGEIVSPGSAGGGFTRTGICTIVDMDSLEIEVDVNEAFIGRVEAGQRVIANLDAYPDWDIEAAVIAIIPTADRAKATVKVRIQIKDKDARILPDMGAKVAFLRT